jgi:dipeptidyl aminopeptidase/acylaminoacyl peptidase
MKTTRTLAALLGLAAVLLLAASPAGAHGGEGQVEITSITRDGDDVTVVAHLIYVEDGHGVPDATVTVVVDDGTPVPMAAGAEEGDYEVTVPAPAGAAIRVTSVEPATTAETAAPAAEEETTTTTEASTTTAETTTTVNPTTGDVEPADGDEDGSATTPAPADSDDDGGISPIVIGAIVAVVVAVGVTAAILLWKKPDGATDDNGEDAPR